MNLSNYKCLVCGERRLRAFTTFWECEQCAHKYATVSGIPKLLLEENLGFRDLALRDAFYNGFLGRYYQHVMPFLALPVRPGYWGGWLVYAAIVAGLLALTSHVASFLFANRWHSASGLDIFALLLFVGIVAFLFRQRYLLYLLLLAVPVKISLLLTRFQAKESFPEAHNKIIAELLLKKAKLRVLDISTGSCNSLYRHGWMRLDAEYTGLDLSETMLLQGLRFMTRKQVLLNLVLGSATELPFVSDSFDVTLNYGALNGYTDPKAALEEMARVTKPGGLILFLDEQLYESASWVERIYFHKVLSSHNAIHHCPVELLPDNVENVTVRQIYHYYYLCTCYKKAIAG